MRSTLAVTCVLACASTTYAYNDGSYYGGSNGNGNSNSNGGYSSSGYSGYGFGNFFANTYDRKVVAHAVLACIAFGFLFPAGGILIRLASFRGLWLVHGIWQLCAYALYIAAFGLGIYLVRSGPRDMLHDPHPIIGIILLALIFCQPFFGLMHHFLFKKHLRRTLWSYVHLWLGRIIVTLGIINGGLGLRLASRHPFDRPSKGAMAGYGVAAGFMWLMYVLAAIIGERRRSRVRQAAAQTPMSQKAYATRRTSTHGRAMREV